MPKYKPLEMPRGTAYGNNYNNTYSVKLQRNVILYSQLEYHNFLALEMNRHGANYMDINIRLLLLMSPSLIVRSFFSMDISSINIFSLDKEYIQLFAKHKFIE